METPPAPFRLLVVDDDENNRDMLARRLERRGYAVELAIDGAQCLAMAAAKAYDLILLDVMMPGISGFEVLKKLRETQPATRLPIIMATAKSEREDIVEALRLGANDYVTKPLDFPVVAARVETALAHKRSVDRILALERDLEVHNQRLQEANERMNRDLQLAARMQQSLLPSTKVAANDVHFAWNYRPCDELAGDILNVLPLGPDHIGLYLLDVSGHGVPAALLSVTLSRILAPVPGQASLVEVQTPSGLVPASPAVVLEELNRRFQVTPENSQYFTLVYALLHRPTGKLTYAAAGHPPAFHITTDRQTVELRQEAFPIGWVPDATYEEGSITLHPGERLLIYSDGATESTNHLSEEFGRDRLAQTVLREGLSLDETLTHIRSEVESFCSQSRIRDDISLLAMERV